jgi:hypothetical protein
MEMSKVLMHRQDVDTSSSSQQPSMRTLRAGAAGIDLHSNLDGSDGMYAMLSESLESLDN